MKDLIITLTDEAGTKFEYSCGVYTGLDIQSIEYREVERVRQTEVLENKVDNFSEFTNADLAILWNFYQNNEGIKAIRYLQSRINNLSLLDCKALWDAYKDKMSGN